MKMIEVYTKGREGQYEAVGAYYEDKFVVKKGAKLGLLKAINQVPEYVRIQREDSSKVKDNILQCDVEFKSASVAALFVTGNISNGLRTWKTSDGKYLRESIKGGK